MKSLVFSVDDRYVLALKVLWHTLFQTDSVPSEFSIYILHEDSLSPESIVELKAFFLIYRAHPVFKDLSGFVPSELPLRSSDHVSRATFYRLYIASILPKDIQFAAYLDIDMIAIRSIKPMLLTELGAIPLAAVDHLSPHDQLRLWGAVSGNYFNAGLMLINLRLWRELGFEKNFEEVIQKQSSRLRWWDQDVLNIALHNKWARLPIWFNVNHVVVQLVGVTVARQRSHLIHYTTSRKPWGHHDLNELEILWHKSLAELIEYANSTILPPAQAAKLTPALKRSFPKVYDSREELISAYLRDGMVVAEIGVLEGRFSEFIHSKAKLSMLYMVDLFEGTVGSGDQHGNNFRYIDMNSAYARLNEKYRDSSDVSVVQCSSQSFFESLIDNSLDLVYIDADHSYAGCFSDLEYALSKVKSNGYIMGHDYSINPLRASCVYSFGVKQAVDEFCSKHDQVIQAKAIDGCISYSIQVKK